MSILSKSAVACWSSRGKTCTYLHHQWSSCSQKMTASAIVSPRLSHSSRVPLCARHIKALMMRLKQGHCHPIEIINSSQTVLVPGDCGLAGRVHRPLQTHSCCWSCPFSQLTPGCDPASVLLEYLQFALQALSCLFSFNKDDQSSEY